MLKRETLLAIKGFCLMILLSGCGGAPVKSDARHVTNVASLTSPVTQGGALGSPARDVTPTVGKEIQPTSGRSATPHITMYNGVVLPPSKPVQVMGMEVQLPGAWLVDGNRAFLATYGSFDYATGGTTCPNEPGTQCDQRLHADAAPVEQMPDLATARLPANKKPVVVIASSKVDTCQATVSTWKKPAGDADPTWRELKSELRRDGDLTVCTLRASSEFSDQLLTVSTTFEGEEGGDVTYLWRLNPNK